MEPDLAAIVLDSLNLTVADHEAPGADPFNVQSLKSNLTLKLRAACLGRGDAAVGAVDTRISFIKISFITKEQVSRA